MYLNQKSLLVQMNSISQIPVWYLWCYPSSTPWLQREKSDSVGKSAIRILMLNRRWSTINSGKVGTSASHFALPRLHSVFSIIIQFLCQECQQVFLSFFLSLFLSFFSVCLFPFLLWERSFYGTIVSICSGPLSIKRNKLLWKIGTKGSFRAKKNLFRIFNIEGSFCS